VTVVALTDDAVRVITEPLIVPGST